MKQTIITRSSDETIALGGRFGTKLKAGTVVSLHGSLGSGKTTFVKGLARSLDIDEEITSPSFTIMSEYEGALPLYHLDLYRVDSLEEFELLGVEELFYSEGITMIEWAEKIESLLPPSHISISFRIEENGDRSITFTGIEL